MTDLADLAPSLQNVLARPGMFSVLFPETSADSLIQVLMDGLAECHLEGLLLTNVSDANGLVTPDLDSGRQAMVLLFAGIRLLRAELLNRATTKKYSASGASFEEDQSTNLLRDVLKDMTTQRDRIIYQLSQTLSSGTAFAMADQYMSRALEGFYTGDNYLLPYTPAPFPPYNPLSGW